MISKNFNVISILFFSCNTLVTLCLAGNESEKSREIVTRAYYLKEMHYILYKKITAAIIAFCINNIPLRAKNCVNH